jgi:hypothetical protein
VQLKKKLVENAPNEPRRWLKRRGSVSEEKATNWCVKWPKCWMCNDLKLQPCTKEEVHGWNKGQKAVRVQKCQQLLTCHAGDDIIFSEEKCFLLQETHNQQIDQCYSG